MASVANTSALSSIASNAQVLRDRALPTDSPLQEVSKTHPCPHCGKPDWCYRLGELSACKRQAPPASGWQKTARCDREGTPYYAPVPVQSQPKDTRPRQMRSWDYPARDGSRLVRVLRIDNGQGQKKIWQQHWDRQRWRNGLKKVHRADIPIYRYADIREAIAAGKPIFIVEGEPCAEALWDLGLAATCNIGGSGKWKDTDAADLKGANVVICPDRDRAGIQHATTVAKYFRDAKWLCAFPESPIWQNLPSGGGLDVADWIRDYRLDADTILSHCMDFESFCRQLGWEAGASGEPFGNVEIPDSFDPKTEFTQEALSTLYGDKPWICVNNQLYYWSRTHYKHSPKVVEMRRLRDFCNSYPVTNKNGEVRFPYAKPSKVKEVFEWVKLSLGIDPSLINPPGVNCTNGVLKIEWYGAQPVPKLYPHDPSMYYLYEPAVTYNLSADSTDCDRLLEVLDPPQREIFLRTIAASLDLKTVRRYKGRLVRALLLKGDGNNGKDTLREAVAGLYGYQGMTAATLSDFQQYDRGRKFPLAKLANSRINWASENANLGKLDRVQSLKSWITGDTLSIESKGRDEIEIEPVGVGLFNINDTPNIEALMEAVQSRYAILTFDKTFKIGADPTQAEVEADPRFKYDPQFVRSRVLPALLNRVLRALSELMRHGIDYFPTNATLAEIQRDANHLIAFAQDMKLGYRSGCKTYVREIWEPLKAWYVASGTLEVETTASGKPKYIWYEQPRRSDRNVKAPNQVIGRFLTIFPKAKRGWDDRGFYLEGIGFYSASDNG